MKTILICNNRRLNPQTPSCAQRGSMELGHALGDWLKEEQLEAKIQYFKCLGQCEHGPNLKLIPNGNIVQSAYLDRLSEVQIAIKAFLMSDKAD